MDQQSKTTSHQKKARELIAIYQTVCHSWFLLTQLHLQPTSSSSSSQDSVFDVNRYTENPVPERSGSTSEELRGDPLHESTETENKNKNGESEEEQSDMSHELPDWLQEFSENLVDESTSEPWGNPEQGSQDTSKSSQELPMEPRAKVERCSGKLSVYTHFPKDPNCDICLKTKITRDSCRRRIGTVAPGAGHLVTGSQRITKVSMKKVNRETIIDMPWWYKIWQHCGDPKRTL